MGYSEVSWEEAEETRPTEAKLFRVFLAPINYFNFAFSDEKKWRCFRLRSPIGEQVFYGYAERGSLEALTLHSAFKKERLERPYMLEIRYPEGAERGNQVLIHRVVGSGWVLGTASAPKPTEPSTP